MNNLNDKVIIITGGNGLIGKSLIKRIKSENAICINADLHNQTTDDLSNVICDVTNDKSIDNTINLVLEKYGKIDGLVNNAYPRTDDWGEKFEKISKEIPKNARILMTYGGGSIFKNGIYDAIKKQLDGFYVEEFGGIEPNPTYQTLKKAIELIKTNDLNFILAVGGGSVIDGTKFISAGVLFEGDSWDIPKKGIRVEKAMPFGTVLTLPATGSEMNSGAVITNKETGEKLGMGSPHLFPKFSICNPSVIKSLPKTQIQNGIIDAFTHVLEQYVTYPIGASLQDRISESILKTLIYIVQTIQYIS
jgi:alcohol dehydrogenase YqhD (iron-dependent ADH family)